MNFGTRRSDEVFTELGALVIAGLGVWVCAAVLGRATDGADGAAPAAVEDEGLGMVELMEAVGVCNVGAVAPAQPARTNASAVAPVREPAAYRRGCLT
jgi:hypothetical protein